MSARSCLVPEEPVDLEHERAVLDPAHCRRRRELRICGVAFVRVNQKQLAARRVFPAVPQVRAESPVGGAVLQERAREHQRRKAIVYASAREARGVRCGGALDARDGEGRLQGKPLEDGDACHGKPAGRRP